MFEPYSRHFPSFADDSCSNLAQTGGFRPWFRRQNKLNELSNATDSLELWVKVQLLWTSLESVFMGGDIAKQMPIEAKKFVKIDKDWAKTMIKGWSGKGLFCFCLGY